jgi:zinc protease
MTLILVEENHDLPLARVQVALHNGAAFGDAEHDGLTNFASELLSRGAAGKSRAHIDAAFDALGTSLDVATDYDAVYFELTVLREKLDAALALLADVLLRPDFPEDEADKLRRELTGQLDDLREDDGQLARRFFTRALFPGHPYGRTVLGSAKTLPMLDAARARDWHARMMRRGHMLFGFAGDLDEATARRAVEKHFGALPDGNVIAPLVPGDPPQPKGMRLTLVDKPDRTQSQILLGQPAPRWGTPEFTALQVATCAYGGTFTARLMHEVRSKRGLSYGASARLGSGRGRRAMVVHVFPSLDQTPETLELVLGMHRDFIDKGISADELTFAAGYLSKSAAFSQATPEERLELRTSVAICGLPEGYAFTFPERVRQVTLADTQSVLATLTPRDLALCIVSTADQLLPKLEAAGLLQDLHVDVVPYDSY